VKHIEPKSPFPPPLRFVGDKDLPGLDAQSGTALDVGDNYEMGEKWERESAYTGVGHFQERRLFIQRTLEYARVQAASGQIPQANVTRLIEIFRGKLERINEQERAVYQEENAEQLDALRDDLANNVDKQNAQRAANVEKQIAATDLENIESILDALEQVVVENMQQTRQQQLFGSKDTSGYDRAASIIKKLYDKFSKDCGEKKVKSELLAQVDRTAQLLGLGGEESTLTIKCFSRTAVAKMSLPGFDIEARKCVYGLDRISLNSFEGEWKINVVGVLPLQGVATITDRGKSGHWEAKATLGDNNAEVKFRSNGPAEIVSGGGQCQLWLKPGENKADGRTEQFRSIQQLPVPITGRFPIKILNETCN